MSKVITSKTAPDAIGPYSHGNVFGNLIFTSGQLPVCKEKGGIVDGGVAEQSYQSLVNLRSVIEAGGGDLNTVVKTTCYLANIGDFSAFNEVYAQFFKTECPARSCFAVKDLPMGALVEIEAIAYRK